MTIASEITRLQWAKSDARTSIINKWVDVPANATIDTYHNYIDQIDTWIVDGIFVPASFSNGIYASVFATMSSDIWDLIVADNSEYIHYFWVTDPKTTAYDSWYIYAWIKAPLNNPTVVKITWSEINGDGPSIREINVLNRMKQNWASGVKVSSLMRANGSHTPIYWSCTNVTDTTATRVNLWQTPEGVWTPSAEILEAWTQSCGITEEESISALWKTTMSITGASHDYYVIATVNY